MNHSPVEQFLTIPSYGGGHVTVDLPLVGKDPAHVKQLPAGSVPIYNEYLGDMPTYRQPMVHLMRVSLPWDFLGGMETWKPDNNVPRYQNPQTGSHFALSGSYVQPLELNPAVSIMNPPF